MQETTTQPTLSEIDSYETDAEFVLSFAVTEDKGEGPQTKRYILECQHLTYLDDYENPCSDEYDPYLVYLACTHPRYNLGHSEWRGLDPESFTSTLLQDLNVYCLTDREGVIDEIEAKFEEIIAHIYDASDGASELDFEKTEFVPPRTEFFRSTVIADYFLSRPGLKGEDKVIIQSFIDDIEEFAGEIRCTDYKTPVFDRSITLRTVMNQLDTLMRGRAREILSEHYYIDTLALYDHSGISMWIGGPSCQWDSGVVGMVFVPYKELCNHLDAVNKNTNYQESWAKTDARSELIEKTLRPEAERMAKEKVARYDHYLRGNAYSSTLYTWMGDDEVDLSEVDEPDEHELVSNNMGSQIYLGYADADCIKDVLYEVLPVLLEDDLVEEWAKELYKNV